MKKNKVKFNKIKKFTAIICSLMIFTACISPQVASAVDTGYEYFGSSDSGIIFARETKNMLSSADNAVSYDYSMLNGEGTKKSPYLIRSKEDLKLFRDMVNSGLDFNGKYVEQTVDIDLIGENWVPIGIYLGEHYFYGTYNGNGHIISNLYINAPYQTEEPMNVGFFGILAGTVENLGIINGDVYGSCVGGITSHGGGGTKIINCYYKGKLTGTARAGGIADNISSANSMISNCYFEGTLEAPIAFGINSYWAEQVMNCAYVGNYPCSDESTLRTKNNMQFVNDTVAISEFLNNNFTQMANQGFDGYTFNRWTSDYNGNITLSDATFECKNYMLWVIIIVSFSVALVSIILLVRFTQGTMVCQDKGQKSENPDE